MTTFTENLLKWLLDLIQGDGADRRYDTPFLVRQICWGFVIYRRERRVDVG